MWNKKDQGWSFFNEKECQMEKEEGNEKGKLTTEQFITMMKGENMNYGKSTNLSILTIPEVAGKLKLTNNEAAKKWLEKRGICIHKFSKQNLVYEIEVICEIDKPFVKILRLKYPREWKNIYRRLVKDYNVYELLILQLEGELDYSSFTKVRRINESDEKLYNDLTQ